MLAAGENPAWIARVLGHADCQLLWRTHARYLPNLTRQDGSVFAAAVAVWRLSCEQLPSGSSMLCVYIYKSCIYHDFCTISLVMISCANVDNWLIGMEHPAIKRHIADVLGLQVQLRAWDGASRLPQYLADRYDFVSTEMLGTPCVLAASRGGHRSDTVRKDLATLRKYVPEGALAIYVVEALASYERRRLIEQAVPFIVPGNQIYLPDLGVDLREYFRGRRADAQEALSPASQALLILTLLRPWQARLHPSMLAENSDYSPITAWRVAKEWMAAGFAEPVEDGRSQWVCFSQGPKETWVKARRHLRSPVRAVHWAVGECPETAKAPLAGLSALAERTALAGPTYPARALGSRDWQRALKSGVQRVHGPDQGTTQYEVWRYEPRLLPDASVVDPLSLILSLQEEPDERVAQAVEQLEGQLPW